MQFINPKYKAQKSEAVKNLEALNNGKVFVPKWVIAVGITTLVGLAVVFSASIAISVTRQPNGLYQESCEKRSCEKKLGLKCLNKICLCPDNQFYLDKCYNLSTNGEICQKTEHCKSEENLLCGIGSKCDCDLENYWNANSKKCVPRKTYMEACNGDECKSEFNLACQSGICDCQSKQTKYWNGSSCLEKKKFNESCGTPNECLDSEGTLCLNSKCSCPSKEYFKISESRCMPKLGEFETCSYDDMCLNPMFCSLAFGCRCQRYTFFHSSSSSCANQNLANAKCTEDNECRQDLGLTCQSGICACASSDFSWSSKSFKCKLTYAKSACSVDSDCNESENLICRLSNECNCPISSTIRMCDCIRNQTREQYWNGSSCVQSIAFRSPCSASYQCRTLTESTVCSSENRCECPDDTLFFWDGEKCLPKKTHNQSCDANNQCLDSELTICNNSFCQCDSKQYYELTKCRIKLGEFQLCTSSIMCLDPMTCVSYKCICGENEYFESITSSCIPKLIYGFSCNSDSECRSDLNLVCANYQCVCNSLDRTWSYLSNNCLLTYSKGYCSSNSECNTDQKLICQSNSTQNCSCPQLSQQWVCDCDRTADNEKYWNGNECIEANTFARNCTENYHCQTITENTVCDQNICTCSNLFKEYFNGIRCVPKKIYMEECTEPQQCLNSESTFCNSTHCVCQETEYFSINKCVSRLGEFETCFFTEMCLNDMVCNGTNCMCLGNKFYDNTTNKCTDQKIFNNYCDKNLECRSDLGLVCTGNRCICGSSSHAWSNIRQECLLTYSKRFCLTNDACNPDQNLKCINNDCNCPIASVDGMCDCSRAEGSEEFWDGSVCSTARNYADYCSNDFECQTKTQNTLCIAGFCVCSNYSIEFWNGNKCQSKKRHLETCNQKSECLDSDITDCINNVCSCPTGQYYNEVFSKCVARLSEFEACVNDTMCLEAMNCHSLNKYCICNTDEYFENITSECRVKKSINIWCDNDWQCSSLKGLTCQSNRCLCTLNTHTWDTSQDKCRLTYSTLSCSSNDDCNTSENLICTDFTNRCSCPSNQTFKICDCSNSNSVNKYWNGSSCVNGKSFGLPCNFLYECNYKQKKLNCRDGSCQCEENEKFESNKCIEKCPIGTLIFDNQCFYFSNDTIKGDKADDECDDLKINGHKNWRAAIIRDSATNNFLKEYFQSIGSTEVYWLDEINDGEWKENEIPIDTSLCPPLSNSREETHYHVDCFYKNIDKDFRHKFMCRKTF